MTDTRKSIDHIDDTLTKIIIPQLRKAVRQLSEFVGEFPATASGAPPSTTGSRPNEAGPRMTVTQHDDGTWQVTVERLNGQRDRDTAPTEWEARRQGARMVQAAAGDTAPNDPPARHDKARLKLQTVHRLVWTLTLEAERLSRPVRTETITPPAGHLESRLEYIAWHITQCKQAGKADTGRLDNTTRIVNELARICEAYQPATTPAKWEEICVAHERAKLHAMVDERFRRHELCRPCGEWRAQFGDIPPPPIVKMLDKGQYRDARRPDVLRRFKVKIKKRAS